MLRQCIGVEAWSRRRGVEASRSSRGVEVQGVEVLWQCRGRCEVSRLAVPVRSVQVLKAWCRGGNTLHGTNCRFAGSCRPELPKLPSAATYMKFEVVHCLLG